MNPSDNFVLDPEWAASDVRRVVAVLDREKWKRLIQIAKAAKLAVHRTESALTVAERTKKVVVSYKMAGGGVPRRQWRLYAG